MKWTGHFITLGVLGTLMSQALHSVIFGKRGLQAPRVQAAVPKAQVEAMVEVVSLAF